MITNRMQEVYSHDEGLNQQKNSTNDTIIRSHCVYRNGSRNKQIFLLLIAVLIKCFAVAADSTGKHIQIILLL